MTSEEIVRALRCTAQVQHGDEPCDSCPFQTVENVSAEAADKLHCEEWHSCDVDGWTLEVNRLCTDGTHNACSMLYAAAWRAARAMGYKKLVTYILDSENGTSLRAAGWKCVGQAGGPRWTGKRRPEVDLCPAQMKIRFERETEGVGGEK